MTRSFPWLQATAPRQAHPLSRLRFLVVAFLGFSCSAFPADSAPEAWQQKVSSMVWVAYFPTNANPVTGLDPERVSVQADLALLRKAGFTGLLTYGSSGMIGRELPALAQAAGFRGMIVGVWDPKSAQEMVVAKEAGKNPIVSGYCVGNEGLGQRYNIKELSAAMQELRDATSKPTTTAEQLDDYSDPEMQQLGDWIFPTVHPYFHHQLDPEDAVDWTVRAYVRLKRKSGRFVWFKEVGLPTAGSKTENLSEANQNLYYAALAKTEVRFVYFEAFDLPWKNHPPVEPHWGIFHADRSPKVLGQRLLGLPAAGGAAPQSRPPELLYIYEDARSDKNHFVPSGFMGDIGDIHVIDAFSEHPHSGMTCIRIDYEARGKGPHSSGGSLPCKFSGVYWQEPANNWGADPKLEGKGLNLSRFNHLTFWARADKPCEIEFKVGGIKAAYGDSLSVARTTIAKLTVDWHAFDIDLRGADLKQVIGGFAWSSTWDKNPDGATFYLDDIRFENKP